MCFHKRRQLAHRIVWKVTLSSCNTQWGIGEVRLQSLACDGGGTTNLVAQLNLGHVM